MHQLGDQWIETIDGQEHMLKAVEQSSNINDDTCGGCFFGVCGDICNHGALHFCRYRTGKCPLDNVDWIVKDLGILRNGKLPSSFGVYPTTSAPEDENEPWCLYAWIAENGKIVKEVKAWGETEQQAIDAWNRRA